MNINTKNKMWRILRNTGFVLLCLPFFAGTIAMGMAYFHQSSSQPEPEILSSLMLLFGFSVGIPGAIKVLLSKTDSGRRLGTAVVIFGIAHILMGFAFNSAIQADIRLGMTSTILFLIPIVLWVISIILALSASMKDDDDNE